MTCDDEVCKDGVTWGGSGCYRSNGREEGVLRVCGVTCVYVCVCVCVCVCVVMCVM